MEKFKEVVESLGDKVSCWKITKEHGLKWLNRTTATCKNMRMLFWCYKSQYPNYQKRENKNYQFR